MIDAQAIPPRHGEGDHPQDGGGGPPLLRQPIKQIKRARVLRKTLSLPEGLLRRELQKRPAGYRFRRQMPQAPYTIDFACLSARLAIELDGEAHNRGDQPAKDITRDAVLAERGFKTLRLSAYEVLKNMDACITAIVAACQESGPPPPSLRDGPPPRSGEEPQ